jgi:hypothetical protein
VRADAPAGYEVWAAGMRLESTRELFPEEADWLRSEQARLARLGWAYALAGPLVFGSCLGVYLLHPSFEVRWSALAIGFFLGLLIVGGFTAPTGLRTLRAANEIARDLREGTTEVFTLPDSEAGEPEHRCVMRHSGVVLPTDDLPAAWVTRSFLAEVPAGARVASQWTTPLDPSRPDSPQVNRRALSARELGELSALRRPILRWPVLLLLLPAVFLIPILSEGLSKRTPESLGGAIIPGVLTLAAAGNLVRNVVLFSRVGRDLSEGHVMIVREAQGAAVEILPHSGVTWSEDGRPAAWRSGG